MTLRARPIGPCSTSVECIYSSVSIFGGIYSEVVEDEGVDVGVFVDNFCHRFATAVSGFAIDANQLGCVAGVGCLQSCCIFERVGGDYAVVVVGSGNEDGGVGSSVVFDGVDGRVAKQIFSHFRRVGACTVVGSPVPADGEFVVAHHVHNANAGDGNFEEVGAQVDCGTYEETAIATAFDGEVFG